MSPGPKPVQQWMRDGTQRYLTDPIFHARVQMAAQLTILTAETLGVYANEDQKAGILQAATYALLVAEESVEDVVAWWSLEQIEANMRLQAEAMGMMLALGRADDQLPPEAPGL